PSMFAGARAVRRLGHTSQVAIGAGVNVGSGSASLGAGGSLSTGGSGGEVDYLDMNGDRFPDIVGKGHIQYTAPLGGLEGSNREMPGPDQVRETGDIAGNLSIGGNAARTTGGSKGNPYSNPPAQGQTGSQMVQLGVSGGGGVSDLH